MLQCRNSQMPLISSAVPLLCLPLQPSVLCFAPLYFSNTTPVVHFLAGRHNSPALYHAAPVPTHRKQNCFSRKKPHKSLCPGWKAHQTLYFQSERTGDNGIQNRDIKQVIKCHTSPSVENTDVTRNTGLLHSETSTKIFLTRLKKTVRLHYDFIHNTLQHSLALVLNH